MVVYLLTTIHALSMLMLTLLSVDEILLPRYMNGSANFRVKMAATLLTHKKCLSNLVQQFLMVTNKNSIFFFVKVQISEVTANKFVVYWPPTQPGCQNRKCTCASSQGISEYNLDRGRVEWVRFVTPTRRRWALNNYITWCTGSSISWR